jgi:hypothetical protein
VFLAINRCGHCKRLAPTWDDLSKEMARYPIVTIAKVDCTHHGNVCKENGVSLFVIDILRFCSSILYILSQLTFNIIYMY